MGVGGLTYQTLFYMLDSIPDHGYQQNSMGTNKKDGGNTIFKLIHDGQAARPLSKYSTFEENQKIYSFNQKVGAKCHSKRYRYIKKRFVYFETI